MLDKLTEQNKKLKDWIEQKKKNERVERAENIMSYSLMEESRDMSIYSRQVEQSVKNAFNATEEWA